jgi:hypothetical protein
MIIREDIMGKQRKTWSSQQKQVSPEAGKRTTQKTLGREGFGARHPKKVVEPLSMTQADTLYEAFKAQVSLRGFARIMGQPYWRLRDYRRLSAHRSEAADQYDHLVQQSKCDWPPWRRRPMAIDVFGMCSMTKVSGLVGIVCVGYCGR